jgi:ABC-type microcin C transport system duplicated ATPase subunit YejF
MSCLKIKSVSKQFKKKKSFFGRSFSHVNALTRVSLHLDTSRIYALVGESGSGKSTLARILVGLESVDEGTVLYNDAETVLKNRKVEHKHRFQIVFQNPFSSLDPRWTIYQIISEGLSIRGFDKNVIEKKVRVMLDEVGLPISILNRFPHQLSGGQRQRVAIARVLLVEPDVLILDEPVSSLDRTVQSHILQLIKKVTHKHSFITLYISHDLSSVRSLASYVFILQAGKIVEEGETEILFSNPQHPYTKNLLTSFYGKGMHNEV